MPRPYASGIVPADVDTVWQVVRDFNGLPTWHPGLTSSEIESGHGANEVGAVRKLTTPDGGLIRERLVTLDDTDRSYTYDILESPFPVRTYRSTIRLAPVTSTEETFVEWWCDFTSEEADEAELTKTFARGVYRTGINALAKRFSE
ncbi:ribosome-associated toxin RatA of RatAB toxin-antitoxin module [Tamaricihabitans halophyticus]|uniref:Ribosome-associated toxin RatA of RatAB toxin-antitoxin module n=1 Tax=Tamaricihabitans halophyticus TaxID=1262583 RepID=A0A4R2R4H7_9PSEU|nr:SRPBCC family protein [Tamaricihabitans halophyticus]TCP56907.1 ribosome-associated toxin RatA of RatAB toxin-antitoxin module [Tamaricihabitans halophyticus]